MLICVFLGITICHSDRCFRSLLQVRP